MKPHRRLTTRQERAACQQFREGKTLKTIAKGFGMVRNNHIWRTIKRELYPGQDFEGADIEDIRDAALWRQIWDGDGAYVPHIVDTRQPGEPIPIDDFSQFETNSAGEGHRWESI